MKKYSLLGLFSLLLVLTFQNCGQAPNAWDTKSASAATPSNQQYNKYAVEGYSTLSLYDMVNHRFLDLNLSTGQVVAFEEAGQIRGETYQISDDKLAEVNSILSGAEICEPVIDPSELENRMCTMEYGYPYSILSDKADEVRLGERANGCDIPVDLCGDKAKQLRASVKSIVESL